MKHFTVLFFLILILIFSQTVVGQDQKNNEGTILLNHIALHVTNLEESRKFYEDVLGLDRIPEPFKDGLHEWFSMGGFGQLHLIAGAKKTVERNRNNHLCFSVKSIDNFINNLEQHSVEWTDWAGKPKTRTLRVDGVTQIYFKDPDGYWLEINNDGHIN